MSSFTHSVNLFTAVVSFSKALHWQPQNGNYKFPMECISSIEDNGVSVKPECVHQASIEIAIESAKTNKSVSNRSIMRTNYFDTYDLNCFGGIIENELWIDGICNSQNILKAFTGIKKAQELETQMAALLTGQNISEVRETIFQRQHLSETVKVPEEVDRRLEAEFGEMDLEEVETPRGLTGHAGAIGGGSSYYYTSSSTAMGDNRRRAYTAQQIWAGWRVEAVKEMRAQCNDHMAVMVGNNPMGGAVCTPADSCNDITISCEPPNVWDPTCIGQKVYLSYSGTCISFTGNIGDWHHGDHTLGIFGEVVRWRNSGSPSGSLYFGPCHNTGTSDMNVAFCGDSTAFVSRRLGQVEAQPRRLARQCKKR